MTQAHLLGLAGLLLFGVGYDLFVAEQARRGNADFTALPVIVGVAVTLGVLLLDSLGQTYDALNWVVLTFLHFAASGLGMTVGSWRRRG